MTWVTWVPVRQGCLSLPLCFVYRCCGAHRRTSLCALCLLAQPQRRLQHLEEQQRLSSQGSHAPVTWSFIGAVQPPPSCASPPHPFLRISSLLKSPLSCPLDFGSVTCVWTSPPAAHAMVYFPVPDSDRAGSSGPTCLAPCRAPPVQDFLGRCVHQGVCPVTRPVMSSHRTQS